MHLACHNNIMYASIFLNYSIGSVCFIVTDIFFLKLVFDKVGQYIGSKRHNHYKQHVTNNYFSAFL